MYRSLQASAFITGCGKASQVSLNLQARSTAQAVGQPEPPAPAEPPDVVRRSSAAGPHEPGIVVVDESLVVIIGPQPARPHERETPAHRCECLVILSAPVLRSARLYSQSGWSAFQLACQRASRSGRLVSFQDWWMRRGMPCAL